MRWIFLPLVLQIGCFEFLERTKPTDDTANEVDDLTVDSASDQNDTSQTDTDQTEPNTDQTEPNSENDTDTSQPDTDSNNDTPLNPDFIIYQFKSSYENNQLSTVIIEEETISGTFSAILYDTNQEDYCSIDWIFDNSTVEPDTDMNSGSVYSFGLPVETWFGFIIHSTPELRGNCSGMNGNAQEILEMLMTDVPGFGYGPLTENLEHGLIDSHGSLWNDTQNYVFTGFISSYLYSEHGEREYLDINQAYAYPVTNGQTT